MCGIVHNNFMLNHYYNQTFRAKTEKALEIINNYEDTHNPYPHSLAQDRDKTLKSMGKSLQSSKWARVQLLPATHELFQLFKPHPHAFAAHLKIVIKNFNGTRVHLAISHKNEPVLLDRCEYTINSEKIVKFKSVGTGDRVFLTIHSTEDLTIFKLKYEFVLEEIEPASPGPVHLTKIGSLKELRRERDIVSSSRSKIVAVRKEHDIFLELKLGKNQIKKEELLFAREKSVEQERERIAKAKEKKDHIEIYREKSKSLRIISAKCKDLLGQYQQTIEKQRKAREATMKSVAISVCLLKFMQITNHRYEFQSENLKKATKTRILLKKFIQKLKSKSHQFQQTVSDLRTRQLLSIHHLTQLAVKTYLKPDMKKASSIMADCLFSVTSGAIVNTAFEYSSIYRRKVRSIQRFWRERYLALIRMFEICVNLHIIELFAKHPNFRPFGDEFRSNGIGNQLSRQYLKDSSSKLGSIFSAYEHRLVEIEEIKRINKQITEFNAKALRKHQRQYLPVPNKPAYPVVRYFRDLNILKSMVRTWFEIQYRKISRKNKKQKL